MIFSQAQRAAIKEVETHWKSNLVIRCVILVLDALCLGLNGADMLPVLSVWWPYVVLCPSVAWTLFVIIFRLCKINPIHPGVHIGFELCLWVGMLTVGVFSFMFTVAYVPANRLVLTVMGESPGQAGSWIANIVTCVGLIVLSILHFYLFVRSCIDTERRRMKGMTQQAASMAAQIVKSMESRGTFYRRDSQGSYVYNPSEQGGHILGLDELHLAERGRPINREDVIHDTGFTMHNFGHITANRSSRLSQHSHARSGMSTTFSQARTQYSTARTQFSHTRSMSVPVPTSPGTLRTARTDEPSLYEMSR